MSLARSVSNRSNSPAAICALGEEGRGPRDISLGCVTDETLAVPGGRNAPHYQVPYVGVQRIMETVELVRRQPGGPTRTASDGDRVLWRVSYEARSRNRLAASARFARRTTMLAWSFAWSTTARSFAPKCTKSELRSIGALRSRARCWKRKAGRSRDKGPCAQCGSHGVWTRLSGVKHERKKIVNQWLCTSAPCVDDGNGSPRSATAKLPPRRRRRA